MVSSPDRQALVVFCVLAPVQELSRRRPAPVQFAVTGHHPDGDIQQSRLY